MNVTKTDWFFIVNPHAGSGKTMCEWIPAEQKCMKLGIPYTTSYTDYKRHATSLAYEAAAEGYRKILAVGGDGSVHEAFNGIMEWCDKTGTDPSEFTLAVAPIGSGNDWIKSLDVPHDMDKVIGLLAENSIGKMDVVRLESGSIESEGNSICYMANIGGIGFDSHVCERVNKQKERGRRNKRIYLNSLLYAMRHLKPIKLSVLVDGKELFSGECLSVALGNGRYSGSGMRQVPGAVMDDGLIDITVIPKMSFFAMLKELPRLFTGTFNESGKIAGGRGRILQIIPLDASSRDIIELDGEIEGRLPATFSATGKMINVIKGQESTCEQA